MHDAVRFVMDIGVQAVFVLSPTAYATTIVTYLLTVLFIWRGKQVAERLSRRGRSQSPVSRVREQRLMKRRFRVPIMKLSLNVVNFVVCSPWCCIIRRQR